MPDYPLESAKNQHFIFEENHYSKLLHLQTQEGSLAHKLIHDFSNVSLVE